MTVEKFKKVRTIEIRNVSTKLSCDFCRKDIPIDKFGFYPGTEITFHFGYRSEFDGCIPKKCHMCDKCAKKFIFTKRRGWI